MQENITPISRKRVKYTAKKQLKGQFANAIRANWIVILYTIFETVMTTITVYYLFLAYYQNGQIIASSQPNDYVMQTISSAIATVFVWSAKWAIIDFFQNPKEKVRWRQSLQAFKPGYFFPTLLLAFVQRILLFLWSILIIPVFVKMFSYSQTYYAYKMDMIFKRRTKSLTDYITISRRVMNGRKLELFKLELSFIGWHLLGVLTLGLAYIYITPYLNTCRVVYSSQVFAEAVQKGIDKA